jgi:hypothetical protein
VSFLLNPLAQKFYEKYEKLVKIPTPGFRYHQVYALKTSILIDKEYLNIQQEVRTEFIEIGLELVQS